MYNDSCSIHTIILVENRLTPERKSNTMYWNNLSSSNKGIIHPQDLNAFHRTNFNHHIQDINWPIYKRYQVTALNTVADTMNLNLVTLLFQNTSFVNILKLSAVNRSAKSTVQAIKYNNPSNKSIYVSFRYNVLFHFIFLKSNKDVLELLSTRPY